MLPVFDNYREIARAAAALIQQNDTVYLTGGSLGYLMIAFLTGGGLTAAFGLSIGTDETASFQRTVMRNSRRKYLLMPGAKIGVDSFVKVCAVEEFDGIITDWECVEDQIAAIEEKGIEVTVLQGPE